MTHLPIHVVGTAPEASAPLLDSTRKYYGFVPNVHGVLASSPAAITAYTTLDRVFADLTNLDSIEQHVVSLAITYEQSSCYCMAAHSMLAKHAGMDDATLNALRTGSSLPDPKLDALAHLSRVIVQKSGHPSDGEIQAFLEAGWTRQHVLDILVGVAFKTLSNYTNHIADTPVDVAFARHAWSPEADTGDR